MKVGDLVRLKQEYQSTYDNRHNGLVGLVVTSPSAQLSLPHYRLVKWAGNLSNGAWLAQPWMYPAEQLEVINASR